MILEFPKRSSHLLIFMEYYNVLIEAYYLF